MHQPKLVSCLIHAVWNEYEIYMESMDIVCFGGGYTLVSGLNYG